MSHLPLGREVEYPNSVDPTHLVAIDRSATRQALHLGAGLPFRGDDEWTAYELSWLDDAGRPQASVAVIRIDAASRAIVESKSLKLYLGGFAMTRFVDPRAVIERIQDDLAVTVDGAVRVSFERPWIQSRAPGFCLDALVLDEEPSYDQIAPLDRAAGPVGSDTVHTRLFRSVCPVTGQPDWGSIAIGYRGRLIERAALLRFLLSFRTHSGFHEDVVEQVFCAVAKAADTGELYVAGRFLRRGGIDINPTRIGGGAIAPVWRDDRQ